MNTYKIVVLACAAVLVAACTSQKKERKMPEVDQLLRPASMNYSSQDSANINALVSEYAVLFGQRDFNSCSNMLYKLQNDSIKPLSDGERQGFVKAMNRRFKNIYAVRPTSFVLRSDKNNDVKITIQIDEDGDIMNNVGTISMSLNPVLKDGTWYLTLLDRHAEGVQNVYEVR